MPDQLLGLDNVATRARDDHHQLLGRDLDAVTGH
jgi:hypothetical protein